MQRKPKFVCGAHCESSSRITVSAGSIRSEGSSSISPARQAKLPFELDGGQHALQQQTDSNRTAKLALRGYRVIRFWNNDVIDNLAGVLEVIRRELDAQRE